MKKHVLTSSIAAAGTIGFLIGSISSVVGAGMLGSTIFSDIASDSSYDEAVGHLYEAGIIEKGDGRFRPDEAPTRAEVAQMLHKLRSELKGVVASNPLPPPSLSTTDTTVTPSNSSDRRAAARAARARNRGRNRTSVFGSRRKHRTRVTTKKVETKKEEVKKVVSQKAGPAGAFEFGVSQLKISESARSLTVGVRRTGEAVGSAKVSFKVLPGTALENEDYIKNGGTLSFRDREKSKTFTVSLKNDDLAEGNETFFLELYAPADGAVLGKIIKSTVTIIDDERKDSGSTSTSTTTTTVTPTNSEAGSIGFSATEFHVSEKGTQVTIRVERTGGSKGAVGVDYETKGGTARSGTDYEKATGKLSFADGETTKTFTVNVPDNSDTDGNKMFTVHVLNPTGGAGINSVNKAHVTIVDDDAGLTFGNGKIRFSQSTFKGSETSGRAEILVKRFGGAQGEVTIDYKTNTHSASISDFKPINGTLTFKEFESEKMLVMDILKDNDSDSGEVVYLDLSNPTGGSTLDTPSRATITIYER